MHHCVLYIVNISSQLLKYTHGVDVLLQAGRTVPVSSLLLGDPTKSCWKLLLWREAACWVERMVAGDLVYFSCERLPEACCLKLAAWSSLPGACCLELAARCLELAAWSSLPGARCLELAAWSSLPEARCLKLAAWSSLPEARCLKLAAWSSLPEARCLKLAAWS